MSVGDQLAGLYQEIDGKATRFADISALSCPTGCGRCCDNADTEIHRTEADLIAAYIRNRAPELEQVLEAGLKSDTSECIFYDADNDLHCRIYNVRPLICRCYGYCAEFDRTGAMLFPACQHMDLPDGLRAGGGVVRILFEPHPPVMSEYRAKIGQLLPSADNSGTGLRPLGQAVKAALDHSATD